MKLKKFGTEQAMISWMSDTPPREMFNPKCLYVYMLCYNYSSSEQSYVRTELCYGPIAFCAKKNLNKTIENVFCPNNRQQQTVRQYVCQDLTHTCVRPKLQELESRGLNTDHH